MTVQTVRTAAQMQIYFLAYYSNILTELDRKYAKFVRANIAVTF